MSIVNANVALYEIGANNHNLYPIGYLNFLNLPKLSCWKLHFKVGCPIMLCYNNTPKHGLCNGFQFIMTCLSDHVIDVHILTNTNVREKTCVLRIILQPTTLEMHFKFIPKKIPMKVDFAMTIKKSLGQFVKYVSLDL